ncbi:MAG: hypothetical protein RLZZ255_586, partial [Cyanobacteriota bacterium]
AEIFAPMPEIRAVDNRSRERGRDRNSTSKGAPSAALSRPARRR